MKKNKLSSVVLSSLLLTALWCIAGVSGALAGSTPFAYIWTITMPNDQPYRKCRIVAHSVSYYSDHVLDRGDSWEWSPPAKYPPSKLTYVEAECSRSGSTGSDLIKLQSRTCTGVDSTGSVAGDPRCAFDIRVKVCRKISGTEAGDFSYGFCPDQTVDQPFPRCRRQGNGIRATVNPVGRHERKQTIVLEKENV